MGNGGFDPFALFPPDLPVWVVGGAVRDIMSQKVPCDWDIVVDIGMEDLSKLTGGKVIGPEGKQVCIFASSGSTVEALSLTGGSILSDLSRRDFTVNAMALDREGNITDPYGGAEDLLLKKLRFVPDLEDRLREDPIRALRFCRFSAVLGLAPVEDELEGLRVFVWENRGRLANLPRQRVGREMVKGLAFPRRFWDLLRFVGLNRLFLPPINLKKGWSLPEGPSDSSIILGLMGFLSEDLNWSHLMTSWGLPVKAKREAKVYSSVLKGLSRPLSLVEAGDLALSLGTFWRPRLQDLLESGCTGNLYWRENLEEIDLALFKLRVASERGVPLSGGEVAEIIGPGPDVSSCLERLRCCVLSHDDFSFEEAMAVLRPYR